LGQAAGQFAANTVPVSTSEPNSQHQQSKQPGQWAGTSGRTWAGERPEAHVGSETQRALAGVRAVLAGGGPAQRLTIPRNRATLVTARLGAPAQRPQLGHAGVGGVGQEEKPTSSSNASASTRAAFEAAAAGLAPASCLVAGRARRARDLQMTATAMGRFPSRVRPDRWGSAGAAAWSNSSLRGRRDPRGPEHQGGPFRTLATPACKARASQNQLKAHRPGSGFQPALGGHHR